MPVPFIVLEKTNPRNPQEPRKYYAHAKSSGAVDLRTLATQIAEISTLSNAGTGCKSANALTFPNKDLPSDTAPHKLHRKCERSV